MKKLVLVACFAMLFGGCGSDDPTESTMVDAGSPTFPYRDSSVITSDTSNSRDAGITNDTGNTNGNVDSGFDCDTYACPGTLRVLWTNEACSNIDSFSILYGLETINIPCNRLGFATQFTPSNMTISILMLYNGSEIGRINQHVMIRSNEVVTVNIP